jgi:hypothetical protein
MRIPISECVVLSLSSLAVFLLGAGASALDGASAPDKKVMQLSTQPLSFEPNLGQTAFEVEYLSRGKASTLFLTRQKAVLVFDGAALEMKLKLSNLARRIEAVGQLPGAMNKPVVYQERDGRREVLDARYVLKGRTVTVELAQYDRTRRLVIDPMLSYSSY